MRLYTYYILPILTHLSMRSRLLAQCRRRTVGRARGVVLELGLGSGLNLPFYDPGQVSLVYAVEPEPGMIRLARKRMATAPVEVRLLEGGAERIALPDASVDTVLSTWTLCTIVDVERALTEVRRVLKRDGTFVFTEHGLSPEDRVARCQNRLTPAWRRFAGGCHLNRKHDALLEAAGFRLMGLETGYLGIPKPMSYMYEGYACACSDAPNDMNGCSNEPGHPRGKTD
ncbi:MAG: class I SAM-dependent methyltransferase [Ectothiorhodospiraceae bacterium]|nr:class I SAM-dependent methyltransferase [Ectothiorhodospiraceae bacterium]